MLTESLKIKDYFFRISEYLVLMKKGSLMRNTLADSIAYAPQDIRMYYQLLTIRQIFAPFRVYYAKETNKLYPLGCNYR